MKHVAAIAQLERDLPPKLEKAWIQNADASAELVEQLRTATPNGIAVFIH